MAFWRHRGDNHLIYNKFFIPKNKKAKNIININNNNNIGKLEENKKVQREI